MVIRLILTLLFPLFQIMCFRNDAEKKELQNFLDLLKNMLVVDKNGRIIPLKVLEHPFFTVEPHTDSSHNMNITNLTPEPHFSPQPSSQRRSVDSLELYSFASTATTPREEIVLTHPENESAQMEDEEDEAAHIQPG